MLKGFIYKIKKSNIFHYLVILFIGGLLCGTILSQWIEPTVIDSLSETLVSTFIHPEINQTDFFVNQFVTNLSFGLLLLFFGFSLLGMPIISFIIFTKGVQIGFSSSLYLITYHLKGMLGIILTLLPQILFDSIAMFILGLTSFKVALIIFERCFFNTKNIDWKKLFNENLNYVLTSLILILFSSIIKATVVISMMELFALIQA